MRAFPPSSHRSRPRRGIATLEMVLVLPILVLLAALIFVVGMSGTAQLHATIGAREDAYKQRHGPAHQGPPFLVGSFPLLRSPEGDLVAGSATRSVKLPKALSWMPKSRSAHHAVLAGSWDHHSFRFASAEDDLRLVAQMAVAAKVGSVQDALGQILGAADSLSGLLDQARNQASDAQDKIGKHQGDLNAAKQKYAEERKQLEADLKKSQQLVQTLTTQVDQVNQDIKTLEQKRDDAMKNIKDETEKKKALKDLDAQLTTKRAELTAKQQDLKTEQDKLQLLKSKDTAGALVP